MCWNGQCYAGLDQGLYQDSDGRGVRSSPAAVPTAERWCCVVMIVSSATCCTPSHQAATLEGKLSKAVDDAVTGLPFAIPVCLHTSGSAESACETALQWRALSAVWVLLSIKHVSRPGV